jgi:hypothetical protein
MRHKSGLALAAALGCATAAWAADKPTMAVFFTVAQVEERKEVDDATKNALKAKRDQAREARKALEKQLKDQLGKKRESWPPEKDDELYRAEEAEALADAEYDYRKIDPKAMSDGLKDLIDAVHGKGLQAGKKDHIVVATSAAEADLVVEVLGRRAIKALPTQIKPNACYLLFSVGAGGRTAPEKFASVPPEYRMKRGLFWSWKIASPRPERPIFVFEGYNGGTSEFGCHDGAANSASQIVDKFVEDNRPRLTGQ